MSAPTDPETHHGSSYSSDLVLHNRLEELSRLATWIEAVAGRLSLSTRGKFRLEMVLTEAVANVIQHGSEADKEQQISVILEQAGDDIRVEVRDAGRPFDPLKQPKVVFPRTLDDASQGGLGIHLMRSYSDECGYRREAGENVLTLIIRDAHKPGED